MNIAFLHPTLGLGGAERLVVDAALALQARGHRTTIFTAEHAPRAAFAATVDGRLAVRVHGALPGQLAQRLRAPLAIARMHWLAVVAARQRPRFDALVCDLVAHVVPFARRLTGAPVVFYCHFPDRLLATPARRRWYPFYRAPIDAWEAHGIAAADRVLVNSAFTAATYMRTFQPSAAPPTVLHPGVDVDAYDASRSPVESQTVVSISRFAPDKNLALAVDAYAALRAALGPARFAPTRLIVAGGYDAARRESRATLAALQARAAAHGLGAQIEWRCSPSDAERTALLADCRAVLYTPRHEHFGYGPIEAMAAGRPVVAVREGGPLETVVDGESGWLCAAEPAAFAAALRRLFDDPGAAARMGRAGRARAAREFSLAAFGAGLAEVLESLHHPPPC